MEVRVEAVDGTLPQGCYISVRVGDVQKQTLYDPRKLYRFPEARRFGKVDVYQRVGTCDLSWAADEPESRVCKAIGSDGDTGMRFKISMSRPAATQQKEQEIAEEKTKKAAKTKEISAAAKKYLQENDVEGILTGAMRALLKSTPTDVPSFLCDYIRRQYGARDGGAQQEPTTRSRAPCVAVKSFKEYNSSHIMPSSGQAYFTELHRLFPPPKVDPIIAAERIRDAIRSRLEAAYNDGSLEGVLSRSKAECRTAQVQTQVRQRMEEALDDGSLEEILACQSRAKEEAKRWMHLPSVGSWGGQPKLQPLRKPQAQSSSPESWSYRPSVGTWLHVRRKPPDQDDLQNKAASMMMMPGHVRFGGCFFGTKMSPGVFIF